MECYETNLVSCASLSNAKELSEPAVVKKIFLSYVQVGEPSVKNLKVLNVG